MAEGGGTLARFNTLAAAEAERELLACCAAPAWAHEVAAGRPYPDIPTALTVADAALRRLPWAQVATALAAHPRIGERPTGDDREAAWSRAEQVGVTGLHAELAEANRRYEERHGHIFLIFASGRTEAEMLAAARERLANDETTERRIVHSELGRIARRRLERLLS
jgi:2-oxo-4-hydroxy-4-carboxy-5-ureidoimidazoline decarboxylase